MSTDIRKSWPTGRVVPNSAVSVLIALGALGAAPAEAAGEAIGIVLANRGEPTVERDGEVSRLTRRDEILQGDTIRTDSRSRVEIRLQDDQTLRLSADTELHIEAYEFDEETGEGESRKSLVAGGLRAISGQITGEDNYSIETDVATIGIRGTISEVAHDPETGTTGGTPRGAGFAENRGENQERVNTGDDAPTDYYRVADADTPPEALAERPAELDRLDDDPEEEDEDEDETEEEEDDTEEEEDEPEEEEDDDADEDEDEEEAEDDTGDDAEDETEEEGADDDGDAATDDDDADDGEAVADDTETTDEAPADDGDDDGDDWGDADAPDDTTVPDTETDTDRRVDTDRDAVDATDAGDGDDLDADVRELYEPERFESRDGFIGGETIEWEALGEDGEESERAFAVLGDNGDSVLYQGGTGDPAISEDDLITGNAPSGDIEWGYWDDGNSDPFRVGVSEGVEDNPEFEQDGEIDPESGPFAWIVADEQDQFDFLDEANGIVFGSALSSFDVDGGGGEWGVLSNADITAVSGNWGIESRDIIDFQFSIIEDERFEWEVFTEAAISFDDLMEGIEVDGENLFGFVRDMGTEETLSSEFRGDLAAFLTASEDAAAAIAGSFDFETLEGEELQRAIEGVFWSDIVELQFED